MKNFCILVTLCVLSTGCVVFVPEHVANTMSREPVERESLEFLEVGSTKREDVLLHLGDPDYGHGNERIFVYQWTTKSGTEIKWGGYQETRYVTRKKYQLIIAFDQSGVVSSYEIKEQKEKEVEEGNV